MTELGLYVRLIGSYVRVRPTVLACINYRDRIYSTKIILNYFALSLNSPVSWNFPEKSLERTVKAESTVLCKVMTQYPTFERPVDCLLPQSFSNILYRDMTHCVYDTWPLAPVFCPHSRLRADFLKPRAAISFLSHRLEIRNRVVLVPGP